VIVFPGGNCATPFDADPKGSFPKGAIAGIAAVAAFMILGLAYQRSVHSKHVGKLKDELKKLSKSLVGVRHVTMNFGGAVQKSPGGSTGSFLQPTAVAKTSTIVIQDYVSKWYWQEGADRIDAHNKHDVLQPGNWVQYSYSVIAELEKAYKTYDTSTGAAEIEIDLFNRIASTGNEQKAFGQSTGVKFKIDFKAMTQKNKSSGFVRAIKRVQVKTAAAPQEGYLEVGGAIAAVDMPVQMNGFGGFGADPTLPADLNGPDDVRLILTVGQLVQQHSVRDDGWANGTVLFDDGSAAAAKPSIPGCNYDHGWFPIKYTEIASEKHLSKLQAQLGAGAVAALDPPPHWTKVRDALVAERIDLPDGQEKDNAVRAFKKSLSAGVNIVGVQRIQNMAMWQSYAVKRQSMATRDKKTIANAEKKWLFHGTAADTVPKIIQQGFNRGFAGKNATVFGKGVYFARDSSYSSSKTYSPPDRNGVQQMFLCRVLAGYDCMGVQDQVVPNMRDASRHILYDTTTNGDKSIFVTYHDAQQYPEYLVRFR